MLRHLAPIALVVTALTVAAAGPATAKTAATTKCKITASSGEKLGPTYVSKVTVGGGVTCTAGFKVVKAYYTCRVHNGGPAGRCTKTVLGYHCNETRTSIPTQIDAKVTCTNGHKRVVHEYQQNT
jgi:hypothetical protein